MLRAARAGFAYHGRRSQAVASGAMCRHVSSEAVAPPLNTVVLVPTLPNIRVKNQVYSSAFCEQFFTQHHWSSR